MSLDLEHAFCAPPEDADHMLRVQMHAINVNNAYHNNVELLADFKFLIHTILIITPELLFFAGVITYCTGWSDKQCVTEIGDGWQTGR